MSTEEEEVNDEAFCLLLWQRNGGKVSPTGRVYLDTDQEFVRGRCTNPADCFQCGVMQEALAKITAQGIHHIWVCPNCASVVSKEVKEGAVSAKLPGYFTEGYCQRPSCERAADDPDPEARKSILLQLLTFEGDSIP